MNEVKFDERKKSGDIFQSDIGAVPVYKNLELFGDSKLIYIMKSREIE